MDVLDAHHILEFENRLPVCSEDDLKRLLRGPLEQDFAQLGQSGCVEKQVNLVD